MAYSTIEGVADTLKGYEGQRDYYEQRREREEERKHKRGEREYQAGERERKSQRRAVTEGREDIEYDYQTSERSRTDTIRKVNAATAKLAQSKGRDYKDFLNVLNSVDPESPKNYTNLQVGNKGGVKITGGEGMEPIQFKSVEDMMSMVQAQFNPEKWHETQKDIKSRTAKQTAEIAKEGRKQKSAIELEDVKSGHRIALEKAKAKVKQAQKIPAELQITTAIFENLKQEYQDIDPIVLWREARKKATASGNTPKQVKASFIKSFSAILVKEGWEGKDLKNKTKQMTDENMKEIYGDLDENGLPVDMRKKPQQAIPGQPVGQPAPQTMAVPPGGAQQPVQQAAPQQGQAQPQQIPPEQLKRIVDKHGTGGNLYQFLMKNNPQMDQRTLQQHVKNAFPNWIPGS